MSFTYYVNLFICSPTCEVARQKFYDFHILPMLYIWLPFEEQASRTAFFLFSSCFTSICNPLGYDRP